MHPSQRVSQPIVYVLSLFLGISTALSVLLLDLFVILRELCCCPVAWAEKNLDKLAKLSRSRKHNPLTH